MVEVPVVPERTVTLAAVREKLLSGLATVNVRVLVEEA